jgi:hypothetical protein
MTYDIPIINRDIYGPWNADNFNQLTQQITLEDFINFSRRENFRSYIYYTNVKKIYINHLYRFTFLHQCFWTPLSPHFHFVCVNIYRIVFIFVQHIVINFVLASLEFPQHIRIWNFTLPDMTMSHGLPTSIHYTPLSHCCRNLVHNFTEFGSSATRCYYVSPCHIQTPFLLANGMKSQKGAQGGSSVVSQFLKVKCIAWAIL